jgi:mannose-6-phosphate isomerase-like protein (cupin superfamily)
MTSQRHLGRFWGWVNTERLGKGPLKRVGLLIDLRNILHTAFAADSRYGPIYGYDSAEMIIQGLLRQGYRLGSGAPVSLLGYSGGAQIALVSAGYLQATLRAPVQVISLGGLMNPSPALDQIAALTHFYGRRDTMQRLSAVFFPGRWPRRTKTRWARGVASGTIRMICLGPMDHAAVGSYFDDGTYMPDGRSFMQISVNAVANQIRWLSGTNSLDERSLYRRGLGPLDISVLNAPMGHMNKQGDNMDGYVHDIADIATANEDFRRVLYTAAHCQLVVMALKPQEDIGAEVHTLDQCLYVAEGTGEAVLDGVRTAIHAGSVIVVPAGVHHNIINTGSVPLRLSTLYAPPNHRDGVIHHTRAEADADSEHFDGKTTEDAAREHVIHA